MTLHAKPANKSLKTITYYFVIVAVLSIGNVCAQTDQVDTFINDLNSNNPNVQSDAIFILKKLKDPRSVEPLIRLLETYEVGHIRSKVIDALAEIKDPRAVNPLILMLNDKDIVLQEKAINALSEIGEISVDPLISTLSHKSWRMRANACIVLGKIKSKKAIYPLLNALDDEYSDVRLSALQAIGEIKDDSVDIELINRLDNKDAELRDRIENYIIFNGSVNTEFLLEKLKTNNVRIKESVVTILGSSKKRGDIINYSSFLPLLNMLKEGNYDVRRRAAKAFWMIKDQRTETDLFLALTENDEIITDFIVLALEEIKDKKTIDIIIESLKNKNDAVRISISKYWLKKYENYNNINRKKGEYELYLGHNQPDLVYSYIGIMRDNNAVVRKNTAKILGYVKDNRSVETLIVALDDEDIEVKRNAAWSLGEISDIRAIKPLTVTTKSEDWKLRETAESSLVKIKRNMLK